ncbi:hypothetical protein [Deminuibacter soli]|nr:hypothetical protein [Deminuibacter soli]
MINKIAGIYVLLGSISMFVILLYSLEPSQLILNSIPLIITVLVDLFYFIAAFLFVRNPERKRNLIAFLLCLTLYSIQFQLCGFCFKNMIGPLVEIGVKGIDEYHFFSKARWFVIKILNGYNSQTIENYFSVNIIHILLLLIVLPTNRAKLNRIKAG